MNDFHIYAIKVNALIGIFYLAYHFLVQKETFFNSNRFFLLAGLATATVLPLISIKKIVYIEAHKSEYSSINSSSHIKSNPIVTEHINWDNIGQIIYWGISILLILGIIIELISFFKLIRNKNITISKPFALVDLNENINPFSFFKYIVFNSAKYSNSELENIINHEKVHSIEKHSLDILVAKIFCSLFWFNPFIWLYKKAIIQNLEYIADQKAIQNTYDKKAYQMTLLKVVTDHNYLSITSSFYQSLIKKRIVMLNKNQSEKKNAWKYAIILPVLIAFIAFFQIKVEAQEKLMVPKNHSNSSETKSVSEMIWTKNATDEEIKEDIQEMKKIGLEVTFSNLKRNAKGEIISIKVNFKDINGETGGLEFANEKGINSIALRKEIDANNQTSITLGQTKDIKKLQLALEEQLAQTSELETLAELEDIPEAPEVPALPDLGNMPQAPISPELPSLPNLTPPTDPDDKKAWDKYETEMKKYEKAWNTPQMKKYQEEMAIYEKKMKQYKKNVLPSYEKQMKKYEAEMKKYEAKIKKYEADLEMKHKKNKNS
ncbi:MAG: M56 family metallopeptidase [Limnohabitans sp.]|nr:M56 family metallopeptidase [Limnohabitans sp.]